MKSTRKSVKGVFEDFIHQSNIYIELCKEKLRIQIPISGQQTKAGSSAIIACISATEQEIQSVMENLAKIIDEKLDEKLVATSAGRQSLSSDTLNIIKAQSSTIVSEVYSALIVEFEPKFLALSNELKFLRNQIIFLEERVKNAEQKLDMYDQDLRLDSLLFSGIKQPPSSDLKSVIGGVIRNKMEIAGVCDGDIVKVRRFKLNSSTTRQDAVAPVLVKFRWKQIAIQIQVENF